VSQLLVINLQLTM